MKEQAPENNVRPTADSSTAKFETPIPAHKLKPYTPRLIKKGPLSGQARSNEDLNCKVKVDVDQGANRHGRPVECRHLAIAYLQDKYFLDTVAQTRDDIARKFGGSGLRSAEKAYTEWLKGGATTKQLVGAGGVGKWLRDIAANLHPDAPVTGALLLMDDHVVAVRFKLKAEGVIRITCYDPNGNPNGTGNHKALEAAGPQYLSALTMTELFSHWPEYQNGKDPNKGTVTAICPGVVLKPPHPLSYLGAANAAGAINTVINGSLSLKVLDALCKKLSGRVTPKQAVEFLTGSVATPTYPLHIAAFDGHSEVFKSVAHLLVHFKVDSKRARQVLEAKDRFGFPALYCAANVPLDRVDGPTCADMLTAMATAVQRLGIKGEPAKQLLEGRASNGTPALYVFAAKGAVEAFPAMASALKSLGIVGADAKAALEARSSGQTALHVAVQNEVRAPFTAFARALMTAEIPLVEALEMLNPVDSDGNSCLETAEEGWGRERLVSDYQAAVTLLRNSVTFAESGRSTASIGTV